MCITTSYLVVCDKKDVHINRRDKQTPVSSKDPCLHLPLHSKNKITDIMIGRIADLRLGEVAVQMQPNEVCKKKSFHAQIIIIIIISISIPTKSTNTGKQLTQQYRL